jgi:hypothetical protein
MRSLGKQCRANQVQHHVPSAARIGAAFGRSCHQARCRLAGSGSRHHHASTILRAVAEAVQGENKELVSISTFVSYVMVYNGAAWQDAELRHAQDSAASMLHTLQHA